LYQKIRAYGLQDQDPLGCDTYKANQQLHAPIDARRYERALWILQDYLQIKSIVLCTANPHKMAALKPIIVDTFPAPAQTTAFNHAYMSAKNKHWQQLTSGVIPLTRPRTASLPKSASAARTAPVEKIST